MVIFFEGRIWLSRIKTEVSKDAYLLQVGQEVQRVEWHFYQSAASNTAEMSKKSRKNAG